MQITASSAVTHNARLHPTLAIATLALAACNSAPAPPDTRASDEAAIRSASKAWSDAIQAKDLDKAVSFYAPDAVQMADNGPLVGDSLTLRAGWQKMLAVPGPGLSLQASAVQVAKSGDIAYEYGTYDFAISGSSREISDQKGKYVVIWKKQADGIWKAAIDINNTDALPPPAPARSPAVQSSTKPRKHH
jgi:uncharacterized protein (TIGR02246 family)